MPTLYEFAIAIEDDEGEGQGGYLRGYVDMDIVGDKARKLPQYIFSTARAVAYGTESGQEYIRSEGQLTFRNIDEALHPQDWAKAGIRFTAPDIYEDVKASDFILSEDGLTAAIETGEYTDFLDEGDEE